MPAAKIQAFAGMLPALDDTTLPDNAAAYAQNAVFGDNNVRGFRPMFAIRQMTNPLAKKVFRIPRDPFVKPTSTFSNSVWMEFPNPDTDVLRSPVVNDSFDRYYWTTKTDIYPRYNPMSRIEAGGAGWRLGVPVPIRPTVVVTGGTNESIVTRAYTYTWVTGYGEEGPPAPAHLVTDNLNGSWRVTAVAPSAAQMLERNLTHTRFYRTIVSGSGVATYFRVVETGIGTLAITDAFPDTEVSANPQLESMFWHAPPPLDGWVSLPNGSFAGWDGANVHFSEPFRPHAWPAAYSVTVDSPIIGMGVHGQTLIVLTKGNPHAISGIRPSQMAQAKIPSSEPCLSRGSIVSTLDGVVYASQNGLAVASASGVRIISDKVIDKERWLAEVDPYRLRAVRHGTAYLGFVAPDISGLGFMMDKPPATFVLVDANENIQNIMTDIWSGETMTIHSGFVWHFNPAPSTLPGNPPNRIVPYKWRSKIYELPMPHNFAIAKVRFSPYEIINFGGPPITAEPPGDIELTGKYAVFRLYANDELVFAKELRVSGKQFRLPCGFKSARWQVEIEGRVLLHSIEVATSARELAKV